jgi:dihydroflavonol-4-reductase
MVAVTGASGFIGSHLVDRLLADGARVRCLVRASSRMRWHDAERVDVVRVDFEDEGSLSAAVEGCQAVFHVAGANRVGNAAAYRRANEDVTRRLVRACRRSGAADDRFVLVSSLAAAGPSAPGRPRTEDDPPAPVSPYGRSKLAAETALRDEAADALSWTIVRPSAVYGPRDEDFLKLLRMARAGWVARAGGPPQPVSVIHVLDLVEAMVRAARANAAAGRVYFAAHARVTDFDEIARIAARSLGRERVRWVTVPRALVGAVGRLAGVANALAGRANPLPADRLRDLLAPAWCCSPSRIETEVGWTARVDLEEGLADTVTWYRAEGRL